jgi:hypothetical protein
MKRNFILLVVSIIQTFVFSCTMQDHVIPTNMDIYISGSEEKNGIYSAKYWKNGKEIILMESKNRLLTEGIAVVGNDVHVIGATLDENLSGSAIHWKNGQQTKLTGANPEYLFDIKLYQDDVYLAGRTDDARAVYFKNGTAHLLSAAKYGIATEIAISGNDVYVAGNLFEGGKNVPKYWKNGEERDLVSSSQNAYTSGIAVSGSDVYICGNETIGNKTIAKYWKNGEEIVLTSASEKAEASDIFVSNGNVYIVGRNEDGTSTYWINGLPTLFSNQAYAKTIFVQHGDVYVAGTDFGFANSKAAYWKNGKPFYLTDANHRAHADAVFVVSR